MLGKQLFLEKLNSPGRLPTLSSPLPSRSLSGSSLSRSRSLQSQFQPVVGDTTFTIGIAFVVCMLLMFTLHGQFSTDTKAATALGKRSWKDVDLTKSQQLEIQIQKKDEELDTLKLKLRSIISSSHAAEANRASQEALITSLQQRHESEKQHKYTAIYALAERSKALDECTVHEQQLQRQLSTCRDTTRVAAAA